MGQKKKINNKLEIQKRRLKQVFVDMLTTNVSIMQFQLTLTDKKDEQKGIKKFIKESEQAIDIINSVVHYDILVSLYNTFLNGKETYFMALSNRKDTIKKWDRTKKGYALFQKLESQARAKSKEEYENRLKQQEMVKKAKEEGKKIEMVLVDGKLQPRIVEEKSN